MFKNLRGKLFRNLSDEYVLRECSEISTRRINACCNFKTSQKNMFQNLSTKYVPKSIGGICSNTFRTNMFHNLSGESLFVEMQQKRSYVIASVSYLDALAHLTTWVVR